MERPTGKLGTEDETLLKRIAALVIDSVIAGVGAAALFALAVFALPMGGPGRGMAAAVLAVQALSALLVFAYFIGMEAAYGQTLGKKAMGIVVVTDEGDDIGPFEAVVRNLARVVDALPTLYLLGLVVILVTDHGQRVGDLAASTYVVETE